MAENPDLKFSISYTTRPKRRTEEAGKDYFFVDVPVFKQMISDNEFLEHALVFDNFYGTSRAQVLEEIEKGQTVILEIDWQGAQQVRENMPGCETVFILPPSVEALEKRLTGRATDSAGVIARRFRDALADMSHWDEFDYVVVNDDLDTAAKDLKAIVAGQGEPHSVASPQVQGRVAKILGSAT
jgi:guanylate kinase